MEPFIQNRSRSTGEVSTWAEEFKRGLTIKAQAKPQRFGGSLKSNYVKPKFARFKLFCQYYDGNADYFSYDYKYRYTRGFKEKVYAEIYGLYDMIEWFLDERNVDPMQYRYMTVFANITNNLSTDTGDFGYHIASIGRGTLRWKKKLAWIDQGRKLDTTVYSLNEKGLFTQKTLPPCIDNL